MVSPRFDIPRNTRRGLAAQDAGHIPAVERDGKRFRIVCPCGFATQKNWTRKHAFQAITEHMMKAGREQLEKELDQSSDDGVSNPGSVGGRA